MADELHWGERAKTERITHVDFTLAVIQHAVTPYELVYAEDMWNARR